MSFRYYLVRYDLSILDKLEKIHRDGNEISLEFLLQEEKESVNELGDFPDSDLLDILCQVSKFEFKDEEGSSIISIDEEGLKIIINRYIENIIKNYKTILLKEEGKLREWVESCLFRWETLGSVVNLKHTTKHMSDSCLLEHDIFNLLMTLKTFDFSRNYLVLLGW